MISRIESLVLGVFLIGITFNIVYPSNVLLIICCIPLLFLFPFQENPLQSKKIVNLAIVLISTFLWVMVNAIFRSDDGWLVWNERFFLSLWLGFLYTFIFFISSLRNKKFVIRLCRVILIVLVTFWFLQAIISYATNSFLDYLNLLGIRETKGSAYFTNYTIFGRDLIRPTSFLNEPGTYCLVVYPFLLAYYISNGRKLGFWGITTILTFFLSLSAFGVLTATLFVIAISVRAIKTKTGKLGRYSMLLLIVSLSLFYIIFRFGPDSDQKGLAFRIDVAESLLAQDIGEHLLGNGFKLVEITTRKNVLYTVYVEDLSFAFYAYQTMGLLFCLFIIYLFSLLVKDKQDLLFLLPISFGKWAFEIYLFWVILIIIFIVFHYEKNKGHHRSGNIS